MQVRHSGSKHSPEYYLVHTRMTEVGDNFVWVEGAGYVKVLVIHGHASQTDYNGGHG